MGCCCSKQNSALHTLKTNLNIVEYQIISRVIIVEQEIHLKWFLKTEEQLIQDIGQIAQNENYCKIISNYFGQLDFEYCNPNQFESGVQVFYFGLTLLKFQHLLESKQFIRIFSLQLSITQLQEILKEKQLDRDFDPIIYENSIIAEFLQDNNPSTQQLKLLIDYFDELDDNPFFIIFRNYLNIPYKKNDLRLKKICCGIQENILYGQFQIFVRNKLEILNNIKKITSMEQIRNRDLVKNYLDELTNKMKKSSVNKSGVKSWIDVFEKQLNLLLIRNILSDYFVIETINFDNIEKIDVDAVSEIQRFLEQKIFQLDAIKKNQYQTVNNCIRISLNEFNESLAQYTKQKLTNEILNNLLKKVGIQINYAYEKSASFTNLPGFNVGQNNKNFKTSQMNNEQNLAKTKAVYIFSKKK